MGFGGMALSGLLSPSKLLAEPSALGLFERSGSAVIPPNAGKAKSVIFLFMPGGVSHVESFDPKPVLTRDHGKPCPIDIVSLTGSGKGSTCMKSFWEFRRYGKSGLEVSDLFPHIGHCADDLSVIRSMTTGIPAHGPSTYAMHTGMPIAGHPSMGAWFSYGLGSSNANLPSFVVVNGGNMPAGGAVNYASGFLPASHQATMLEIQTDTLVENLQPRDSAALQRAKLELLRRHDEERLRASGGDSLLEASIRSMELASSMQLSVPEVADLKGETQATHRLYGTDSTYKLKAIYARQCLVARRLVERGVRFVEVGFPVTDWSAPGNANPTWDQHGNILKYHPLNAFIVDQAIAGLLKDLKARGLLEETLVVWAGEFGRTPFQQGGSGVNEKSGRDHHPQGFSIWMAGGGIKGGTVYGATDEYGCYAVDKKTDVHDLHATMLHLTGVHHKELTFRHGGRDYRLTDVHGNVLQEILA